jgi:hypothetical protein
MTEEAYKAEVARLKANEHVKLAQREINLRNKRKKYLYQLRWLEKHGKELAAKGYTLENLGEMLTQVEAEAYALEEEA